MKFDVEKITNECVEWIQKWFSENGKNSKAIIGISGGKDSTIVATLCKEALGEENVLGVILPHGKQYDIEDAYRICEYLNIPHVVMNISKICKAFYDEYNDWFEHMSSQMMQNLPPRVRMTLLYAIAQGKDINGRVANTCNLSEKYCGYSTLWGDSVGDFSPISHLTASEVIEIGDYLKLPKDLVHKTPSDGLCGKTDEESLGFTYEELDYYIRNGKFLNIINEDKITKRVNSYEFKSKMININSYFPNLPEFAL